MNRQIRNVFGPALTLALLMWMTCHTALSQNQPLYEVLQQQFIRQYKAGLVNNSSRIIFEKKPAGWFVRQVEFFPRPYTVRHELWWTADSGYMQLTFDQQKGNSDDNAANANSSASNSLYDLMPYYGYRGWERDALSVMSASASANYYPMALCYAALAEASLVEDAYEYHGLSPTLTRELNPELQFANWCDSSIYFLQKQEAEDPTFQIGGMRVSEHIALQKIKKDLFRQIFLNIDGSVPSLAANLLNQTERAYYLNVLKSCPDGAILFVSGDVDALPLHYLTLSGEFVGDVTVVNLDWLGNKAYRKFIENEHTSPLFSVVSKDLEELEIDFIRVIKYNRIRQRQLPGESLSTQKVRLDGFPDNNYQIEDFDLAQEYSDLRHLLQFVTQNFDNQMDNGLTRYKYFPTHGVLLNTQTSMIRWKIDNNLLTKSDLVFLDLLCTNLESSPICILSTTPDVKLLGLDDLQLQGLVYRLMDNQSVERDLYPELNSELMLQYLVFDYSWEGNNDLTKFQYLVYWNLFYKLVDNLVGREKYTGAEMALDKFFKVFSAESWHNGASVVMMAEYYAVLGRKNEAGQIMQQVLSRLNAGTLETAEAAPALKEEIKRLNALHQLGLTME